ncbi:hypothetical protein B0A52_01068 [Exophiala mesophila]|uniref:SEC7 domain-containing protein n=1 Tax=Exophiala mesophila TaxID=212818 RepID=A0A438NGD5_EXOME|nr:hypothetical protein B0A52_01068 [Exophiala mesophila]
MAASGSFFSESPAAEHVLDAHEDVEDPHDLSFSSNHILRASMVDNLVMSLDQFSANFDDSPYNSRNVTYDTTTPTRPRTRGHTLSSSVSSEGDAYDLRSMPKIPEFVPRNPPRPATRHPKSAQNVPKLPSIFGEDEDSVRSKVYDAQRAPPPAGARRKKNTSTSGKSTTSSNSSSIDLGHLAGLSERLGAVGKRRSRSFDYGSRQRVLRTAKMTGEVDGVPTPGIFSGSESHPAPNASITALPLIRKPSNRSSKSAHGRKGRSNALGTATVKNNNEPAMQIHSMKSSLTHPGAAHDQKHNPAPSPAEITPVSRPGFFRRVFGSSKAPAVHSDLQVKTNGRSTPVHDETPLPSTPTSRSLKTPGLPSTDVAANKENHPVLTKKSSAFFRRRKKSISTAVPPPLPLALASQFKPEPEVVGDASPVSSLRAFMDPYLNESQAERGSGHVRTNSMQGFYTPNLPPPSFNLNKETSHRSSHRRTESHGSNRTLRSNQKPTSNLLIPHQDSFLADNSSSGSLEDPVKKSLHDSSIHSDNDRSGLRARQSVSELNKGRSSSHSPNPTPDTESKKTIPRQRSWISDRVSLPATVTTTSQAGTSSSPDPSDKTKSSAPLRVATHLESARKNSLPVVALDSTSDLSEYKSAPSTPLIIETPVNVKVDLTPSDAAVPLVSQISADESYVSKARRIFDNVDDEVDSSTVGAWLGEAGPDREQVRKAYMELFDWSNQDILDSLRSLCDHVALKGETQQMDRIVDAFAKRWCACNEAHAFKSSDVVHTICYSILLLNTDLHLADIGQKMTRAQFVRNALPTIVEVAQGKDADKTLRSPAIGSNFNGLSVGDADERAQEKGLPGRDSRQNSTSEGGPGRAWESHIESVLRAFYVSISQEPLPLSGVPLEPNTTSYPPNSFLTIGSNILRRTPSVLSKAHSDTHRGRITGESKSLGARWISKTRSRPRLPSAPGFGSSRTSIDDQSSAWSPSMSSTWSRASLGKTLTSMSVDSLGTEYGHNDYQSSIGFANALSQAIIREDQLEFPVEEGPKAGTLLEDESLELCGAPWAKEGIVKHKCHLEGVDKRSKDRNWNDCFAVIEKGWMRLFSFSATAKSLRHKARTPKAGAVVGGGNWQENAEEVWKFMLRHTIASSLPPPGYSKARPYVWALSLPTGAVHLFSVGTPEIVKEFVHTANYWSARLSKEPMMGGISNMEYGWSDSVVSRTLPGSEGPPVTNNAVTSPRPSTQMSMRSSMEHVGGVRARLAGDRAHINEWSPPQQSMFASQLLEVDQLKALQTYVNNVEDELQKHNELRGMMLVAFTTKHPNSTKAMNNWEKKSSYLLREIVKFRTYIDTLQNAQATKGKIYQTRKEEGDAQRAEIDSRSVEVE